MRSNKIGTVSCIPLSSLAKLIIQMETMINLHTRHLNSKSICPPRLGDLEALSLLA